MECIACGIEVKAGKTFCLTCVSRRALKTQKAHQAVLRAVRSGRLPKLDGSIACVDYDVAAQLCERFGLDPDEVVK